MTKQTGIDNGKCLSTYRQIGTYVPSVGKVPSALI